jgi:hypothetical protein
LSSVIERLRKRRCYPILLDGEQIHIRALLTSELQTISSIAKGNDDSAIGFAFGCSVLHADGTQVFQRTATESDVEFGTKILVELDLPLDTKAELTGKIMRLSQGPIDHEQLKKN